ncbi:hypothetical protein ACFWPQ_08115 [Streptomyces sp. NPDC058464]|uniref:hypothetical protein n=1 Tax=Streptomyces sp. NPDC058464 TaxID=3346511 RepID=UPI00366A33AA
MGKRTTGRIVVEEFVTLLVCGRRKSVTEVLTRTTSPVTGTPLCSSRLFLNQNPSNRQESHSMRILA